jgi:DNA-binding response OmpR family regulator
MAKILIVDADHKAAKTVARGLKDAGHTCAIRHGGKEALDLIESEVLDLLLIDPVLPDISGFAVCRKIRRTSELFHLPIVFFSTMSNPEEIQHGLAQGADDFIPKPIDVPKLVQHVTSLLNATTRAKYSDPVTGLPDVDETRRRLQLWITRGDRFGLISCELLGLRRLTQESDAEARDKALRHLGRALKLTGESFSDGEFFTGHMGGGFFLCLVPPEDVEAYASKLLRGWRKHRPGLYETLELHRQAPEGPADFLDLLICTTVREARDQCSAQDLLDTLTRIRRSVNEEVGGVHVDRRHAKSPAGTSSGPSGV